MSTSPRTFDSVFTSPPSASTSRVTLRTSTELVGRLLLTLLFLLSGLGKLGAYGATAGYMASVGVPGALLPLVFAVEILGSVAILLGWQTRDCMRNMRSGRFAVATTSFTGRLDELCGSDRQRFVYRRVS